MKTRHPIPSIAFPDPATGQLRITGVWRLWSTIEVQCAGVKRGTIGSGGPAGPAERSQLLPAHPSLKFSRDKAQHPL